MTHSTSGHSTSGNSTSDHYTFSHYTSGHSTFKEIFKQFVLKNYLNAALSIYYRNQCKKRFQRLSNIWIEYWQYPAKDRLWPINWIHFAMIHEQHANNNYEIRELGYEQRDTIYKIAPAPAMVHHWTVVWLYGADPRRRTLSWLLDFYTSLYVV